MVEVLTVACVVAVLIIAVLVVAIIRLTKELRLMARFLETREPDSNARVTLSSSNKAATELAKAINSELDKGQTQQIEAQKSQLELQENLAYLSHDIRTPLTGAQGYAQLLKEEDDSANRQLYLASIERRLVDLRHLLDQLFVFTQVRSEDFDMELSKLDANEVLSDVLVSFYPQFGEKGLEPSVALADEACFVLADEEALSRIFQNLVANALRYAEGSFAVSQQGNSFVFSNSIENPEALDSERLFERFYRGEESRTSQGSGLGLAIVEQLASKMGATVTATIEGKVLAIALCLKSV